MKVRPGHLSGSDSVPVQGCQERFFFGLRGCFLPEDSCFGAKFEPGLSFEEQNREPDQISDKVPSSSHLGAAMWHMTFALGGGWVVKLV